MWIVICIVNVLLLITAMTLKLIIKSCGYPRWANMVLVIYVLTAFMLSCSIYLLFGD